MRRSGARRWSCGCLFPGKEVTSSHAAFCEIDDLRPPLGGNDPFANPGIDAGPMDAHQLCGSLRAAQFRNDLPGVSHATYCSDIRYECKPSVAKRETDGNSGRCHDRYMIEQWAKAAIDARSERA